MRAHRALGQFNAHDDEARVAAVLPLVEGLTTVAAHVAIGSEPPTALLLKALQDRGITVLLPVLQPDGDLGWARWDPSTPLERGPRGTSHPSGPLVPLSEADLVLAPAVAVDVVGNRLGQGGGSYDRALPRRRPGVEVWAWIHPGEVLAHVPVQAWDVPVDGAVLPSGLVRFQRPGR